MDIITRTFESLRAAKTISEVERITHDLGLEKYQMDNETYPNIEFKITKAEIEKLKEKGIIKTDNSLSKIPISDPLTNLLYSVLWKNGDLKKVKHIVDGIVAGQEDEKDNGLVFYQFGKYLTKKPGEPIIDQHVLRAFGIYKADGDKDEIERLRRLSLITKRDKGLIDQYKLWLQTGLTKELCDIDNYSYYVDKVLFAVGKSVKERN